MSGHSKWSKIKRSKGLLDSKRGKIFAKFSKEIAVACKHGGGDPGFNPRLRTILLKARAANMPADNLDRAIKKGTGELAGVNYEEIIYEGYAPGGVAVLVEALTDNKNRTAGDLRAIFTKYGGNLAGAGAVKHLFHRHGQFLIARDQIGEDALLTLALEAGADDVLTHAENYEVMTEPNQFEAVSKVLEASKLKPQAAEIAYLPALTVTVTDVKVAGAVLNLLEALDDNDDVQNVYSSVAIPDAIMEKTQPVA